MGCWTPPFGNPQVLAGAPFLAELLAACAAGASVPLGKGERVRARLRPHLHRAGAGVPQRGRWAGGAPLPPRSPKGKFADHARQRMGPRARLCGNASANLRGSSCREAARSSVTPLARLWPQATLARPPAGGIPKGAQPSLASLCLLSAGQKVGARRGLSASKGKSKILKKGKGIKKAPSASKGKLKIFKKHKKIPKAPGGQAQK